jgi:hypothetical protein
MTITAARLLKGRFTGLTIILVFVFLSLSVIGQKDLRELIVGVGFSALLLFAIWSVRRRLRIVTIALAVPAFISYWTPQLIGAPMVQAAGLVFASAFLGFLTLVIVFAVFQDQEVTADTIVGAVCAYLLLGVTCGTAYALIVFVSPGSLSVSPALAQAAGWGEPIAPFTPLLQYYSFSTLATLGYGDATPLGPVMRTLSVLEGVTGQLYLAVLIARLVGMHTARVSKP